MTLLLTSCKEENKETTVIEPEVELHSDARKTEITDLDLNHSWTSTMEKDNGALWQANAETSEGVAKMEALIAKSTINSPSDYRELANGLNAIKNTIVKECTMEGASHDNLHIWLHPLIEKIEALSDVEEMNQYSADLYKAVQENIKIYHSFFK